MLDDFSAVKLDSEKQEAAATSPGRPPVSSSAATAKAGESATPKIDEEAFSDDDFAKQLQAGMAELMGEIENSVSFTLLTLGVYL